MKPGLRPRTVRGEWLRLAARKSIRQRPEDDAGHLAPISGVVIWVKRDEP
jgi:hypothetical protein